MTVNQYHKLYLSDIETQKPLVESEVLNQIKKDYSITDKEDIENAHINLKTIEQLIEKLIDNRVNEVNRNKRIINEYFFRSRILSYFVSSSREFVQKWNDEVETEFFTSEEYDKFTRRQAIRLYRETSKRKKGKEVDDVLGDFTDYTKNF